MEKAQINPCGFLPRDEARPAALGRVETRSHRDSYPNARRRPNQGRGSLFEILSLERYCEPLELYIRFDILGAKTTSRNSTGDAPQSGL